MPFNLVPPSTSDARPYFVFALILATIALIVAVLPNIASGAVSKLPAIRAASEPVTIYTPAGTFFTTDSCAVSSEPMRNAPPLNVANCPAGAFFFDNTITVTAPEGSFSQVVVNFYNVMTWQFYDCAVIGRGEFVCSAPFNDVGA